MDTKTKILQAAVKLALHDSYRDLSRSQVARLAVCSENLVSFHYKDMLGLRDAVMEYAVFNNIPKLVAQGVSCGDPIALVASKYVRAAAVEFVRGA